MPESTVRAPSLNDAVALTAQAALAPWNLIFSVALPFWAFMTSTRIAMFLLTTSRNPIVIVSPPGVRLLQHLLLLPLLLLAYRAALSVGWPEKRRALAVAGHTLLAFGFALFGRPCLVLSQAIHDGNPGLLRELVDSELGPAVLRNLWVSQTFDFLLSYCFGLALLIGAATYHELKHEKLRTAKLQYDSVRARLQALRMQLNPHFLFNTLNTAVAVLRREPATAEKMLVGLSELLRRILREGEAEQATLEREAAFVRKYLEIERLRFSDRLAFDIDVPKETECAMVPGLLLQPLAENAVAHGVAHEDDSVRINVRARREAQRLVLEVENSVAAQPSRRSGMGIGLSATRERLRAMFGAEHDVELSTSADGSVIVRVSIPFIQSGSLPVA
jgi:hypothetical protein